MKRPEVSSRRSHSCPYRDVPFLRVRLRFVPVGFASFTPQKIRFGAPGNAEYASATAANSITLWRLSIPPPLPAHSSRNAHASSFPSPPTSRFSHLARVFYFVPRAVSHVQTQTPHWQAGFFRTSCGRSSESMGSFLSLAVFLFHSSVKFYDPLLPKGTRTSTKL